MTQPALEPAALAPLLQAFFTEHLISHRLASPQTVDGYRDAFRLLLEFLRRTKGKAPSALCLSDLDAPVILEFLDYLEPASGCDSGFLPSRRAARSCQRESGHPRSGDPGQAGRPSPGGISDASRDRCCPGGAGSDAVDRSARLRLAADDVQQRRARFRGRIASAPAHPDRFHVVAGTPRQGAQGT
jgi:hypothetical protein